MLDESNVSMMAMVIFSPRSSLPEDLTICTPLAVAAAMAAESPAIVTPPLPPNASSGKPISCARGSPSARLSVSRLAALRTAPTQSLACLMS
ncbi:hypothetical protein [Lysobacter gummosus]|uniref:hypothetical protein n=1 Tax=Lysobacter gummosus TaxID=262324 RepID=UPI003644E497